MKILLSLYKVACFLHLLVVHYLPQIESLIPETCVLIIIASQEIAKIKLFSLLLNLLLHCVFLRGAVQHSYYMGMLFIWFRYSPYPSEAL